MRIISQTSGKSDEISVTDNGTGISVYTLTTLFKLDYKYTVKGTEKDKGTGLGLILCKEFIEKNGGSIWAESVEGEGSTFYFTIPLS
ncbi:MAG: HAMP domain-containing histidine kinase [Bacteroidales bacterium]|nr:HAMP domain-containing histidine kinase [Bacteroidales bacterium]